MTQSSDIESASDFIANTFQSVDLFQVTTILVQASVESKFIALLKKKLKNLKTIESVEYQKLEKELKALEGKGFEVIQSIDSSSEFKSSIIRCPRNLIAADNLPIVNLEVFRTTKEGISFAKSSQSIGLWCENLSIAFEFINGLKSARQIWLNSSHGKIHPKIPFNGKVMSEDSNKVEGSSIVEVKDNLQFQSTFQAGNFTQTVVIPFGESFAN